MTLRPPRSTRTVTRLPYTTLFRSDYSPLGKILVHGADAGEFLSRIYVNNLKTQKVGKYRYGLMLNEFGIIIDDSIATRWGESTYQVGTTSGQDEHVVEILEER